MTLCAFHKRVKRYVTVERWPHPETMQQMFDIANNLPFCALDSLSQRVSFCTGLGPSWRDCTVHIRNMTISNVNLMAGRVDQTELLERIEIPGLIVTHFDIASAVHGEDRLEYLLVGFEPDLDNSAFVNRLRELKQ